MSVLKPIEIANRLGHSKGDAFLPQFDHGMAVKIKKITARIALLLSLLSCSIRPYRRRRSLEGARDGKGEK